MAFPTSVNDQITDSAAESSVQVLGSAHAQALAALSSSLSHSLALAAGNAVAHQQSANIVMEAVTTRAVARILGTPKTAPND
jgi:hypothetical protein